MRTRVQPFWLVLLLACGPTGGTEVGNPTFACGDSEAAGMDGAGGSAPACDPRGEVVVVCADGGDCALADFGEVAVGERGTVVIVVEHRGCGTVTLAPPELDGGAVLREGPDSPVTLIPGRRVPFTLGFTPVAPGPTGGNVRFALEPGGDLLVPWIAVGR